MKITHSEGDTRHAVKIDKCEKYRHLHCIERGSDIEHAARVAFIANATKRCPMHDSPIPGQATVIQWGSPLGSDTI